MNEIIAVGIAIIIVVIGGFMGNLARKKYNSTALEVTVCFIFDMAALFIEFLILK